MTPDSPDPDPRDELATEIADLHERALAQWEADPALALIGTLLDYEADYHQHRAHDPAFQSGFRQAVHHAINQYVTYSDWLQCECEGGTPHVDELNNPTNDSVHGKWACSECETVLIESPEELFAREEADGS